MVKAIDIVIAVNVQKCIFRKFITDAMNFLVQASAMTIPVLAGNNSAREKVQDKNSLALWIHPLEQVQRDIHFTENEFFH